MRRVLRLLLLLALVAMLPAGCAVQPIPVAPAAANQATTPDADAGEVVTRALTALGEMAGNPSAMEDALALYAEGVTTSIVNDPSGDQSLSGKDAWRETLINMVDVEGLQLAASNLQAEGNAVTADIALFGEKAMHYGVNPMRMTATLVVEGGEIVDQLITYAPETAAALRQAAEAEAVVLAYAALAAAEPMTVQNLDAYLDFYADNAVLTPYIPGTYYVYEGKPSLQRYYTTNEANTGIQWNFEVLGVDGNVVTTRNLSTGGWVASWMEEAGEFETTEVFVIEDGKIARHTWAPAPDSMAEMVLHESVWDLAVEEPMPDRLAAVQTMMAAAGDGPVTPESIAASLEAYHDKIVFTMLGLPGGPVVVEGKEALQALMESWAATGTTTSFEPLSNMPQGIMLRSHVSDPGLEALGVAPLDAMDIIDLDRDLIRREMWVLSPASVVALRGALAQMGP